MENRNIRRKAVGSDFGFASRGSINRSGYGVSAPGSNAISRSGFLKTVGTGIAAAGFAAAGFGGTVSAQVPPGPTTVVGTGNWLVDVPAVQAAVDLGGTVLLQGTFNFGYDRGGFLADEAYVFSAPDNTYHNPDAFKKGESTVYIKNDVTITGETDSNGNLLTKIIGGCPAFWGGWDGNITGIQNFEPAFNPSLLSTGAPQQWDGVSVGLDFTPNVYGFRWCRAYPNVSATITNIHFDQPKYGAIIFGAGKNVTIEGNIVSNVSLALKDAWYLRGNFAPGLTADGPPQYRGLGVSVTAALAAPFINLQKYIIASRTYPPGDPQIFYALLSALSPTGNVTISDNNIENIGYGEYNSSWWGETDGIVSLFTKATSYTISGNTITNVMPFESLGVLVSDNYGGLVTIENNVISEIGYYGIKDQAILLPRSMNILNNQISNCGSCLHTKVWISAIPFLYPGKHDLIQGNSCSGNAEHGILLMNASNSQILGNNMGSLHASQAQVYLDDKSNNNYFGPDGNGIPNSLGNIVGQAQAGLKCEGSGNVFENDQWVVNYPSWESDKGLWWFTSSSQNNMVRNPYVQGGVKRDKQWKDEGVNNQLIL